MQGSLRRAALPQGNHHKWWKKSQLPLSNCLYKQRSTESWLDEICRKGSLVIVESVSLEVDYHVDSLHDRHGQEQPSQSAEEFNVKVNTKAEVLEFLSIAEDVKLSLNMVGVLHNVHFLSWDRSEILCTRLPCGSWQADIILDSSQQARRIPCSFAYG